MMKRMFGKSAVVLAALTGIAVASADEPRVAPPASSDVANLPRPLRAKQVLGAKLSIQNNTAIGTVDDIVLSNAGDVEYVIVQTDDNKMVTVPWSTVVWNKDYKTATVDVTPEQFKVLPRYTATTYPDYFAPTYRSEVYKLYGTTPGALRRLERRINPRP